MESLVALFSPHLSSVLADLRPVIRNRNSEESGTTSLRIRSLTSAIRIQFPHSGRSQNVRPHGERPPGWTDLSKQGAFSSPLEAASVVRGSV